MIRYRQHRSIYVMRPPIPPGVGVTEFERHAEIFEASYAWAQARIAALEADGNSAIAAILAGGRPTAA